MESCGIDLEVGSSAICVMRDGGVMTQQQAPGLWPMLEPLVKVWRQALEGAERMKKQIALRASAESVPRRLMTAPGVGPLVASAYVATIDDPRRFHFSSQVPAYLGLVPSVGNRASRKSMGASLEKETVCCEPTSSRPLRFC
jgi:transposase